MKRLFLLRHAKAGFAPSDLDRPLAGRGNRDAFWLGQYLNESRRLPDCILCSSARRARESLSQLLDGTEVKIPATFHDDLYLASAQLMADKIQKQDNSITASMIIGHNPGMAILFQGLAHNPASDDRSLKYPTCALGILDFDMGNWSDLESGTGQMVEFVIPTDRIGQE